MIAIIDYGAGNIFSVKNALDYLGLPAALTADPEAIRNADALILPGVGAFPSAMQMLHDSGLTGVIREESRKSRFWVSVSACSSSLKRAMNSKNATVWDWFPARWKNRSARHGHSPYGLE